MNDQEENYIYISHDLNSLSVAEELLEDLAAEKTSRYDDLLTDEIKQGMADIDDELDAGIAVSEARVAVLREQIRQAVIEHGATVNGEFLMATYNKARTSWDTKALNGYAAAHPSLLDLRKTGKPTCSIRHIK